MLASPVSIVPLSSFILLIVFLALISVSVAWKYLVLWSPSFSQETLAFCLKNASSVSRAWFNSSNLRISSSASLSISSSASLSLNWFKDSWD
uniref:Uncharacterized protein n=1 Tax=Picea glauca TaxID=3330 RepID=A0A101M4L1_PICGL|nr:hypothetical protein ABT39_MTgene559 [Picea glauca]